MTLTLTATPNRRDELGAFLNSQRLTGSVAEIGCAWGGFAEIVLKEWQGQFYYMIDPWKEQDTNVYKERQQPAHIYDEWFKSIATKAKDDNRIRPLRLMSEQAVIYFDDGSLDCVYIDGNHDFEHVSKDIRLWYTKVKPGGLIGGHDFCNCTTDGWYCEVQKAVEQWGRETGHAYTVTDCSSWWHRKPGINRYVPTPEEADRMSQ